MLIAHDQDRLDPPLRRDDAWGDLAQRVAAATYDCLSYREREIIHLLYVEKMAYDEVANRFQITPERVRVSETQALRKVASIVFGAEQR